MVAEGALEEDPKNKAASGIADTFTAIVEGKDGIKSVNGDGWVCTGSLCRDAELRSRSYFCSNNLCVYATGPIHFSTSLKQDLVMVCGLCISRDSLALPTCIIELYRWTTPAFCSTRP